MEPSQRLINLQERANELRQLKTEAYVEWQQAREREEYIISRLPAEPALGAELPELRAKREQALAQFKATNAGYNQAVAEAQLVRRREEDMAARQALREQKAEERRWYKENPYK